MALTHRVTILDWPGQRGDGKPGPCSTVHFSVLSATRWIESNARNHGVRKFNIEPVEVDIPGMEPGEAALDDSGPGYAKYREQIDTYGYLRRSSKAPHVMEHGAGI